jgi:hypothetical protein
MYTSLTITAGSQFVEMHAAAGTAAPASATSAAALAAGPAKHPQQQQQQQQQQQHHHHKQQHHQKQKAASAAAHPSSLCAAWCFKSRCTLHPQVSSKHKLADAAGARCMCMLQVRRHITVPYFPGNAVLLCHFLYNMTAAAAVYREFLIQTDSWKMTGHRFRIDCSDFRRKLSRETLEKLMIMILGFLGQSLHHRTPPKLSLGCLQTDPGSSLDAPKKQYENKTNP